MELWRKERPLEIMKWFLTVFFDLFSIAHNSIFWIWKIVEFHEVIWQKFANAINIMYKMGVISFVFFFLILTFRTTKLSVFKLTLWLAFSLEHKFYLFKVNNRNSTRRCEISSKLTIKTPERYQWRVVLFEYISYLFQEFWLLTSNR